MSVKSSVKQHSIFIDTFTADGSFKMGLYLHPYKTTSDASASAVRDLL